MIRSIIKKVVLGGTAAILASASIVPGLISPSVAKAEGTSECIVSEKLVNSCRPWLAAAANNYPDVPGDHQLEILAHEQRIGRQLDSVHLYHVPGTRPLTDEDRFFATRAGSFLSVTWKPAEMWAEADGRNEAVNAEIDATADDFNTLGGTKVMLTIYHEPEDQVSGGASDCAEDLYMGTSGTPADYRAMWQNVRNRFDAKGVDNVVWVMNYMGAEKWNCMVDDMWPGNNLVDWAMWDPYTEQADFVTLVNRFYSVLTNTSDAEHDYLSKPWGLAEWGSWFNAAPEHAYMLYDTAKQAVETNVFPKLKYYGIFDVGATTRIAYDKNGNYDAVELEHYKAFANSPAFSDTVQPDPDPVDTEAPSVVTGLTGVLTSPWITLNWDQASDNVGVTGYEVYRGGQLLATVTDTTYTEVVTQGQTYSYYVRAMDAAGNTGSISDVVTVVVPDTEAPSVPTNLVAVPGTRKITLSWTASTDNVGVAGYYVVRDGVRIATLDAATTNYTDTGLTKNKTYYYQVRAFDAAGNRGVQAVTSAKAQ